MSNREPTVPLALRRLRHVEYLALFSRGHFASNSIVSGGARPSLAAAAAAAVTVTNESIANSSIIAPPAGVGAVVAAAAPGTFRDFFPSEQACCRLEIFAARRDDGAVGADDQAARGSSHSHAAAGQLLHRSEPVAPTRHPRFTPLSGDVRNFAGSLDHVMVRVVAESACVPTLAIATALAGAEDTQASSAQTTASGDGDVASPLAPRQQRVRRPRSLTGFSGLDDADGGAAGQQQPQQQQWLNAPTVVKVMAEFDVHFSRLEYVAEQLSDAVEVLRERQAKEPLVDAMDCLVVCGDGVFLVPQQRATGDAEDASNPATPPIAPPTRAELLKRLGSENFDASRRGGGGGDQGGWEMVTAAHDPDRVDAHAVRASITATMTLHFAEAVLRRRALLEKQRLVEDVRRQLAPSSSSSSSSSPPNVGAGAAATAAAAATSAATAAPSSVRQEIKDGFRRVQLDEVRSRIEATRSQLAQQHAVAEMLREQLRGREQALVGRRRELEQRTVAVAALRVATVADRESAAALERRLRVCRNRVLAGMQKIFPITTVAPHTICGFNIPANEPQTETHACALGCIVHAVVAFCSVHGHTPLHPLHSCTSRSSVAEYVGAPPAKVFPLYAHSAADKEQATRAVMLLRRVMAHAAFAIHNQRQAPDLPFGIALQKLLFNR